MWKSLTNKGAAGVSEPPVKADDAEVRAEIRSLADRVASLERQSREIQLEWDNAFQKLRRIMGRLDRYRALDEAREEPSDESSTNSPSPSMDDEMQRADILRRARELRR